jgi:uroporphyrinogen-III decarboxylase
MGLSELKTKRVLGALEHRETDRVPVGEFFWSSFLKRAASELGGGAPINPYTYWDLDLIVVNPNMDPHLRGIELLVHEPDHKVLKTGFGAIIEYVADYPMPRYLEFETQSFEQMEAFRMDDPREERRYHSAIDDQITSVGDCLTLGLPSFAERVASVADDFCVFGGVCEPHEMLWRIIGTENALVKLAEEPLRMAAFIEKLGDFAVGLVEGQAEAAKGRLSGIYIWGDIAYDRCMFFAPDYWRAVYKPQLVRICEAAHSRGLKTIYHGCGNASAVFEDMIEAGVDAYNPLEAKAGLDVVDLKKRFKNRWAFNGNINVQVLETNDREKVRREVLTKLNAARGGGYILQSDHSIPNNVDPQTYDYMVSLAREYGRYPLRLGEYDLEL